MALIGSIVRAHGASFIMRSCARVLSNVLSYVLQSINGVKVTKAVLAHKCLSEVMEATSWAVEVSRGSGRLQEVRSFLALTAHPKYRASMIIFHVGDGHVYGE